MIGLGKRLEQILQIGAGNADAGVLDLEVDL